MSKEFCPKDCGLKEVESPVCKNNCYHRNDMVIKHPFARMVFGKLMMIVGMNGEERYLEDGSSVHESQVRRRYE